MINTRQTGFAKLVSMIEAIDFGMLTTGDDTGQLRSRPMSTQKVEDGVLWFFTSIDSPKVEEIEEISQVNVSYADPNTQTYVSISGTADTLRDQDKINELWDEEERQWFPDGPTDPKLALIKIQIVEAEYWDIDTRTMKQLMSRGAKGEEMEQAIDNRKIA